MSYNTMETLDILEIFLNEHPGVQSLTFCSYPKQVLIQNELALTGATSHFVNSALKIREKYRLPFWDSLMLSFFDKKDVPEELLKRALLHNKNINKQRISNINIIRNLIDNNQCDNISLNSEIILKNGDIKHFFLIDFHVSQSENNLDTISKVIRLLQLTGYILDSGQSYHFISDRFYVFDEMLDLLAKSLLYSPLIDRAWIAHQIMERSCSIRVGEKNSQRPYFIKKI